jgi:beta-glucosidase/6-phospho-beta-glucosidase/beta-galactosidase
VNIIYCHKCDDGKCLQYKGSKSYKVVRDLMKCGNLKINDIKEYENYPLITCSHMLKTYLGMSNESDSLQLKTMENQLQNYAMYQQFMHDTVKKYLSRLRAHDQENVVPIEDAIQLKKKLNDYIYNTPNK